ncbi:hypothetical protein FUA24_07620 [Seonamhaeicola marinus]|uniref:Uncharacterized protein n=1 Tax=Seonamhaeicola marinus TaxID=1912246 RepID=A0A5D0IGQ3_9FLAO|nr:hypothetical protein FUA24_07620 [Seonamhaeicola marinus]
MAVIKKPTASQWFDIIKINTNKRSKIPIYLPASSKESSLLKSSEIFHFKKIVFIITDAGIVKNNKQVKSKRFVSLKIIAVFIAFFVAIKYAKTITIIWQN